MRPENKLQIILAELIQIEGSVTVERFMRLCLQHPEYGYYVHAQAVGKEGDFITAPEINQIFGETAGVFIASAYKALFPNLQITICELGPGKGTYAQDYLRVIQKLADTRSVSHALYFHDQDKTLIKQQKQYVNNALHIFSLEALPKIPIIFLANEFFDALPVTVKLQENFFEFEGVVIQDFLNQAFALSFQVRESGLIKEKTVVERSAQGEAYLHTICDHIAAYGGGALISDYGSFQPENRVTLRGYYQHRLTNGLTDCGLSDITYDIDFENFRYIVKQYPRLQAKVLTQRDFLLKMFSEARYHKILETLAPDRKEDFISGYQKLISPAEMGEKFKFLWISRKENFFYPFE